MIKLSKMIKQPQSPLLLTPRYWLKSMGLFMLSKEAIALAFP
jgi:hypothetical protein